MGLPFSKKCWCSLSYTSTLDPLPPTTTSLCCAVYWHVLVCVAHLRAWRRGKIFEKAFLGFFAHTRCAHTVSTNPPCGFVANENATLPCTTTPTCRAHETSNCNLDGHGSDTHAPFSCLTSILFGTTLSIYCSSALHLFKVLGVVF